MNWFNPFGAVMMVIIMIPNAVYSVKCKDGFINLWQNRTVETLEQIGRYGCFSLMVFNIPGTWFGFWFPGALTVYMAVSAVLIATYEIIWIICFRQNSRFRALALSILPSLLFLFCGVIIGSVPLTIAALLFAPCHILISYRNAVLANENK